MSSTPDQIVQRTFEQLCVSPYNVRRNRRTATASPAMERSIVAVGLIYPLKVHPMDGEANLWGAHCGGRRLRSIGALIERGELPRDWPINVVVRNDMSVGKLREESAGENIQRHDLFPYEVFAFVADAFADGESVEEIAEAVGQEVWWVNRALRLGHLAKPIFDALEEELIDVDQAQAYAATEDQALQLQTFEILSKLPEWENTPAKIRAALKVGDAEAGRLLRFVGPDVYRAAGGRYELDLFADGEDERGRVVDDELLRRLVNEALAGFREEVRARYGRPELRFVPAPPQNGYGGNDGTLQISPRGDDSPGAPLTLPDGDVVAHVRIAESGTPAVTFWWSSLKAKHGNRKPEKSKAGVPSLTLNVATRQTIDIALKEETGLNQDAVQAFRSVRRVIMRAALVDNAIDGGSVAADYLIWSQLRMKLGGAISEQLGIGALQLPDNGPESARDHVAATEASRVWARAMQHVRSADFFTDADLPRAFLAYRAATQDMKDMTAAVVAGYALARSINADGYELPMHDAIAAEVGLTRDEAIRHYWRPTAAMLDLMPKLQRLAVAEPYIEAATFGPWSRLKSTEITANVLASVTGAADGIRTSMATEAATWVHPLLRFAPIGADAAIADAPE